MRIVPCVVAMHIVRVPFQTPLPTACDDLQSSRVYAHDLDHQRHTISVSSSDISFLASPTFGRLMRT